MDQKNAHLQILFSEKVEKILRLKKNQILCGIMDEEEGHPVNLKECIRNFKEKSLLLIQDFLIELVMKFIPRWKLDQWF